MFIRKWPNTSLPAQFYKSMIPDLMIALCEKCNRFFHEVRANVHTVLPLVETELLLPRCPFPSCRRILSLRC